MKITLLGYGKMGRAVEEVALKRCHEITLKINSKNADEKINFSETEIAIDFSTPNTAFTNISTALKNKIPVISGTTGWLNQFNEIKRITIQNNTAFLHSSNFSIGANLFFTLNQKLADIMKNHKQYSPSIKEIHHIDKLDKPSGTAINLAKDIRGNIPIKSERVKNIAGTHIINYQSKNDNIEIKHKAHNRKGFALGAILAAEWIINRKGIFEMNDVLGTK